MLEYSHVLPDSELLKSIETLYNTAFPSAERRKFAYVETLLENPQVRFSILAATENGKLAGFLSYWEFDTFRYIEHFAVEPDKRGEGIGSEILTHFIDDCGKTPIILEVECPDDSATARRRVDFYMRHSFIIWKRLNYIQPPYEAGGETLELKLMTLQVNDQSKVAQMGDIVKREVYRPIEQY